MNQINTVPPFSVSGPKRSIEEDISFAANVAEEDGGLIESALVAWADRSDGTSSPPAEWCPTKDSWHDYGVSHGGRVEIHAGRRSFIFAEASQFDSYDHFSPSPIINLRDQQGREWICLRTSKTDSDMSACTLSDDVDPGFG